MGSRGSKEIHHYHEDHESKRLAQQARDQMLVLQRHMEEAQALNARRQQEHEEASRQAARQHEEEMRSTEQLHAAERAAAQQRLQAAQEERRREQERAEAQLAQARSEMQQQAREAEEKLALELQKEREKVQKAKLEKWLRVKRDYPVPPFLQQFVNEVSENPEVDAAKERFVNVAVLGDSGTGKSSLIKAILKYFQVDLPDEQMPEVSMEGDGTLVPTRFPLPSLGRVSLWDLPGQGTAKIPALTYLCNMGLKHYDATCIVTDGRWSEGDDSLLAAIHCAGIRCIVARTKVDLAVEAGAEDHGWSVAETLTHVRSQLQTQTRLKSHRVHLVTSRERHWKDFGSVTDMCNQLRMEVEASLNEEAAEQMFDTPPPEDVDMDEADAAADSVTRGANGVEYLRFDVSTNSFRPAGYVR